MKQALHKPDGVYDSKYKDETNDTADPAHTNLVLANLLVHNGLDLGD